MPLDSAALIQPVDAVAAVLRRHHAKPALVADILAVLHQGVAAIPVDAPGEESRAALTLIGVADALERELQLSVGEISLQAVRLAEGADALSATSSSIRTLCDQVSAASDTTSHSVGTVASATQQLETSSREITTQMERAAAFTGDAVDQAARAGATVAGLSAAAGQISGVVRLVQGIAQQTRMLSLNATIEAARAGEAGRGFAVVAAEVKELAHQTDEAIGTVSRQVGDIQRATQDATASVGLIETAIRGVSAMAGGVSAAAGEQRAATGEIAHSLAEAAGNSDTVASNARELAARAADTARAAILFRDLAARVSAGVGDLAGRLSAILRASAQGTGGEEAREPMCVAFKLTAGNTAISGHTGDLSPRGALLVAKAGQDIAGRDGVVALEGLGDLDVRIIGVSSIGIHVLFLHRGPQMQAALRARIDAERRANAVYIALAQRTAAACEAALETALKTGQVTLRALLDTDYRGIEGSDPAQVTSGATEISDAMLRPIIEPAKAQDPAIVFCAPCDRNGYFPTHNAAYSHPQRPGQRDWNIAHCRNRRVFDDRAGMMAGRNTEPILMQPYLRDMGAGVFVMLKEFDAPIRVRGQHWGGLRLAVKMP